MKLFLIKANNGYMDYDKYDGHVIRAKNEETARAIAQKCAYDDPDLVWIDKSKSSCTEIKIEGNEEIILSDYHAG